MTDMFRIPKLAETADGKVVVTHWGQASSLLFRVGDRLILNQDRADGLLILRTKGWGNPMFGRRSQGQLLAEPSGAPASPLRWSVQGSVEAVERDLERGGVGPGRWYVAVRVESPDLTALAQARVRHASGWMQSDDVDALCRKAAVAPELYGVSIAVAAASDQASAERMLAETSASQLRFELRPIMPQGAQTGIVLEGPWRSVRDSASAWQQEPGGIRVAPRRRRVAAGGSRVQLSLFGDTASVDG